MGRTEDLLKCSECNAFNCKLWHLMVVSAGCCQKAQRRKAVHSCLRAPLILSYFGVVFRGRMVIFVRSSAEGPCTGLAGRDMLTLM